MRILRMPAGRRRRTAAVAAVGLAVAGLTATMIAPVGANAVISANAGNSDPHGHGLDDFDARSGSVAPSSEASSSVSALGASAVWNRYGTPASLIKHGGSLATGLSSDPVAAARSFISAKKALFRLSDAGVANLELVNDSKLTGSDGHVVLFRQRFGSLPAAQDGMVSVAVKNGEIFYVSSSLVGDGNAPAKPKLSATAAWQKAAGNVGRAASAQAAVSQVRQEDGWTVFAAAGLNQPQRSRLVALPTPNDGVKSAYETIVYDTTAAEESAHTVFVDAVSGEVLLRVNRLDHLSGATAAMAPTAGEFEGSYTPQACGPKHPIDVDEDTQTIAVFATAVVPANDIVVNILKNGDVVGGPGDTGTSPEVSTYEGVAGDPAGTVYEAQVCPFDAGSQVAPPYAYVGSYVTSNVAASSLPFPPRWKYFLANPPLDGADTDTRTVGCFTRADAKYLANPPALPAGCDREEGNIAARLPWDVDPTTGAPTFTTSGNAARSVEAWASPLVPPVGDNYSPTASNRRYIYPWTDQWRNSTNAADPGTGCSPTVFGAPGTGPESGRNDINASITNLFAEHNRMHDWSYFLGFTENNYNMQVSNFGNDANGTVPGLGDKDPEIGGAQAGAVTGGFPAFLGRDNANQITLNDGVPGITNMYLWQPLPGAFYADCVDGDYDMSVIGHEYTHAISNRMVGGPDAGLTSGSDGQARAMGESYSDLTAVEYLNEYKYVPTNGENPFAVGPYVTGNKETGIRNYPMNNSPLNYSNVQGYDGSGVGSPHDDGEIWSAVNYDIRQAMIAKYNAAFPASNAGLQLRCANGILPANQCPGNRRWMQIVFDAYLMMPPAVSMLGSRDAYLAADRMRFGGANQSLLWEQFARRGFGDKASTTNTDDPQPIPSFESRTATNEATITFRPVKENSHELIPNVRIYVGRYEGRITPIADTDTTTALTSTAKFVPGTYEFVAAAPGYGHVRFTRTFTANQTGLAGFLLLPNWASKNNGATIVATASDGRNLNNLIDDTEASNYVSGAPNSTLGTPLSTPKVNGRQVTVDLGGGSHLVDVVKVSALLRSGAMCMAPEECDPQDLSQSRFSALRQFAIETCTAAASNNNCANRSTQTAAGAGYARIFTSPANAFPASTPRPLAPNLILRGFDVPDTNATHVRMVVLSNQCTGNTEYHGDQDADPLVNSDCRSDNAGGPFPFDPADFVLAPQDTTVRAAELQVFSAGGEGGGGGGTPQDPFVAFTKTGPLTADQGKTVTYKLDYANLGPAASSQAKITDKLPAGVTFVSASGPATYNKTINTVTWNLGTVPLYAQGSVSLTVRVASNVATGTVITNQATFSGALTTATPALAATLVL